MGEFKAEKYLFRKYSDKYPDLFMRERTKLRSIFPKAGIEHIGSSAVPGLGGKGIIDIIISVPKNEIKASIKKLEASGYEHRPLAGEEGREFFRRIIRYGGQERRVHVHLTFHNSKQWKSFIALREYLKGHNKVAKEYEKVKKEAFRAAGGKGEKYRARKTSFLKKLEKKALENEKEAGL